MKEVHFHLICGFNGVGKTTYINKMLRELTGTVTVIQNELGEVELDFKEGESQCVMGGCVCCTLQAELVGVLMQYAVMDPVDHIVMELPSTAKLSSIIDLCNSIARKRNGNFVYHSVDLVDAGRFMSHFKSFGEFYSDQLKYADKVILTRMDKLTDKKKEFLDEKLTELAQNAEKLIN